MYTVDERDTVVELRDLPQSNVGAPCPVVWASEHSVAVAFFLQATPPGWDGSTARLVGPGSDGEPVGLVRFLGPYATMFGPPNDEAFAGHPLASRGLRPYGAYEVLNSSWVRRLERMNAVHPHHDAKRFLEELRHFILAFHDTTFECVATGYSHEVALGSVAALIAAEAARA